MIASRTIRVLLVEDSVADALLIEREIQRGGFEVTVTRVLNATEMGAELADSVFDLVISDHCLPGSGSGETLAVFCETGIDIPFLIVSGTIGDEEAVAAMRAGASDYLLKDQLSRLVPVIERELKRAGQRKAGRVVKAQLAGAEADALREATERARVFEVLHQISTASSGVLDVAELAGLTVRGALQLVRADSAVLRWWEPGENVLRLIGTTDERDWGRMEKLAPEQSILGESFRSRKPIVCNEYQEYSNAIDRSRSDGVTGFVSVPLLVGDVAVGALGVVSIEKSHFTDADAKILGFLADQAGAALEAARLRAILLDNVSLLEASQEVGAIGTFAAWLTPEKAGRDEWSPLTMEIFGYTKETYDGTNTAFWERVHPDDIDRVRRVQAVAHETGEIYDIEHRIVRPDGVERWIHERAMVEQDADGKPIRFLGVTIDITDQELASQALRESAEQFTGAFEGTGMGMALIGPEGRYMLVNNGLCGMLGYSREELIGTMAQDYLFIPDMQPSAPDFQQLLTGEKPSHVVEARFKHRDGSLFWARANTSVVLAAPGIARFYVSHVEDISESIAARAALEASEARNAAVIDATLDAMIVIDGAGIVTAFNPAAERMFGYGKDQMIGRELAEAIVPDRFRAAHRHGVKTNAAENVGGLSRRLELMALRADGTEIPIELSMSRLETDGEPFYSGSIRDLSDRDRLSESQVLLAKVVAAAPVILFACDADGTITLAEGRALTVLGVEAGSAVGLNVFDAIAAVPEVLEHVRRGLGGESFAGAVHLEAYDIWVEASYDPIRNDAGEVAGMVGLATDVSDRVRGEAVRQESDAKSRLVAIVNHEIRTPLNSILGFAELLKLERVGQLNEKQLRYVNNVESAGHHLLALVNDSLDLSKLAAGKMDLEVRRLVVAPIIEEAAAQIQPLLEENGLEIELEVGDESCWIEADRRRLLQILWNLLSNAIRHTPAGGKISIHCHSVSKAVEIVVTDSGVGMAADQLVRIFEEYTQVGVKTDGTGLGLPVSRRLAQLMEGDIRVASELGVGSSFTITLPAANEPDLEPRPGL
jgi:PAS domain S-box-containing protein